MSSHSGPVGEAEGIVWAEGIRLRAVSLADRLDAWLGTFGLGTCGRPDCVLCETGAFLREIAGAR